MTKAPKSCRCSPHSPQAQAAAHWDGEIPGSTHRTCPIGALGPGWGHCQGQGQNESSGQKGPSRPRTKPDVSSLSSVPRGQQGPPGPKGWSHLKVEGTQKASLLHSKGAADTLTLALRQSPGNGSGRWQPCWAGAAPWQTGVASMPGKYTEIPRKSQICGLINSCLFIYLPI